MSETGLAALGAGLDQKRRQSPRLMLEICAPRLLSLDVLNHRIDFWRTTDDGFTFALASWLFRHSQPHHTSFKLGGDCPWKAQT